MDATSFLNAAWSLGRYGRTELRFSLWLLFFAVFLALQELLVHDPGLALAVLLGLPLSMLVHALAHLVATSAVGGLCPVTLLTPINESAAYDLPWRPRAHILVALAGPLASGLIAAALWLLAPVFPVGGLAARACQLLAVLNRDIAILNLLACSVFDGARLWRGLLWPLLGLPRAVRTTVVLSYLSGTLLIVLGVLTSSLLTALIGALCLVSTVLESRSIAQGFDPVLQTAVGEVPRAGGSTWWSRWQARRQARAQEHLAAREAEEQATLDRLLAKVSAHGLPSLTPAERAMLKQISVLQQRRAAQGR